MPKRNSPKDIKELDDLNRLNEIVNDKRNAKRANEKKTRRNRHYEKQFIKNTVSIPNLKQSKMTKTELLQELKNIVKPYVNNKDAFENLSETTDFINDLKINSANLVDIILDVEEKFEIVIDQESMEHMMDVQSTIQIIETKLAEKI